MKARNDEKKEKDDCVGRRERKDDFVPPLENFSFRPILGELHVRQTIFFFFFPQKKTDRGLGRSGESPSRPVARRLHVSGQRRSILGREKRRRRRRRRRRQQQRRQRRRRQRQCATEKKPRVSSDGGRKRANVRRLDYSITIFPLFLFRRILYEWSRGLGEIISRAARRDATRIVVPVCSL